MELYGTTQHASYIDHIYITPEHTPEKKKKSEGAVDHFINPLREASKTTSREDRKQQQQQ